MKNKKKQYIAVLILLIILLMYGGTYLLSSFNNLNINIPCVGLREYTVEEFINFHNIQLEEYYRKSVNSEDGLYLSELRSGNINSMQGLSEFPEASQVENLWLDGTCISQISDLDKMTSLEDLSLYNTEINSMDGLEGLNNIEHIYLDNTKIKTIENVENIRENPSKTLIIFISGKVNSITNESYEYVMDPDNRTRIVIWDSSRDIDLSFGYERDRTRAEVEEQIDII